MQVIKNVWKTNGFRGFYGGLLPQCLGEGEFLFQFTDLYEISTRIRIKCEISFFCSIVDSEFLIKIKFSFVIPTSYEK